MFGTLCIAKRPLAETVALPRQLVLEALQPLLWFALLYFRASLRSNNTQPQNMNDIHDITSTGLSYIWSASTHTDPRKQLREILPSKDCPNIPQAPYHNPLGSSKSLYTRARKNRLAVSNSSLTAAPRAQQKLMKQPGTGACVVCQYDTQGR